MSDRNKVLAALAVGVPLLVLYYTVSRWFAPPMALIWSAYAIFCVSRRPAVEVIWSIVAITLFILCGKDLWVGTGVEGGHPAYYWTAACLVPGFLVNLKRTVWRR